jgi:hypothetical protein
MVRPRVKSLLCRVLVAAFALWLPAATGQGGKATCIAAESLAKSLTSRPHLSCHGEGGAKADKNCCCKGKPTLRAAACGCHDGQTVFGTAAHDPMLAAWIVGAGARPLEHRGAVARSTVPAGLLADAPDPPPPQLPSSVRA